MMMMMSDDDDDHDEDEDFDDYDDDDDVDDDDGDGGGAGGGDAGDKKKKAKERKERWQLPWWPNERRVRETLYHFRRPGHTYIQLQIKDRVLQHWIPEELSSSFSSFARLLVTIISDNSFPFSFTS